MLNVAVIGCGGVGAVHLARWANLSGIRLAAVCDADAGRANRIAAEFGSEAHTDWCALLDDSEFDVVDICTTTTDHFSIAVQALRHGANVLCEEPMALNVAQALEMASAAEEAGRLLMPAFCYRFDPLVLFARELLANDDLGKVVMFRSRFSANLPEIGTEWLADSKRSGGGALMDLGIHSIDLFRCLVGEVNSARGHISQTSPGLSVEDSAVVALRSATGAIGSVECSWTSPGGSNILEIYGTAGACTADFDSGRVRFMTAEMSVWETRESSGHDRFERMIGHFADCVRGNQNPEIRADDGVRANEIIAEIYANV